MPAKSETQRKYLYATKGEDWVKAHGFDTKGPLPAHVSDKKSGKEAKPKRKNPLLEALGQ